MNHCLDYKLRESYARVRALLKYVNVHRYYASHRTNEALALWRQHRGFDEGCLFAKLGRQRPGYAFNQKDLVTAGMFSEQPINVTYKGRSSVKKKFTSIDTVAFFG